MVNALQQFSPSLIGCFVRRNNLQEYVPATDSDDMGTSTLVVVSLIIEIEGDQTK